jgi:hypothetical protein
VLLIEDIRLLPIILKLKLDFERTKHKLKIVSAERLDEKRVRVVIEIDLPAKVLH